MPMTLCLILTFSSTFIPRDTNAGVPASLVEQEGGEARSLDAGQGGDTLLYLLEHGGHSWVAVLQPGNSGVDLEEEHALAI